ASATPFGSDSAPGSGAFQTSRRTLRTTGSPAFAGIACDTPAMPSTAAMRSVAVDTSPSGDQPPRGGTTPAQVTEYTGAGMPSSNPSATAVAAEARARSDAIGTTMSMSASTGSTAKTRSPSTVAESSSRLAGSSTGA